VSELSKPDDSFQQTMAMIQRIKNIAKHDKEHVTLAPVRTKVYDPSCEGCQMELGRIHKLSDNHPAVVLPQEARAKVTFITLLCHLQMHNECTRDYVMQTELVELHCVCACHEK
jgi:hypothetical protein